MDIYIKIEINSDFIIVREKAFDVYVSCSFKHFKSTYFRWLVVIIIINTPTKSTQKQNQQH